MPTTLLPGSEFQININSGGNNGSKYPPAKPGALDVEPLKAALIVHGQITPAQ